MERYESDCLKPLPKLFFILMVAFSTSSSKHCRRPTMTDRDDSNIIRNVGIKLCQLKCVESGLCLSIQYNIDALTCRLSRPESKKTKNTEGYVSLSRTHSDVPTGSCSSRMCTDGRRCLKTRSGKSICVKNRKENVPEKSPLQKVPRDEIFVNSSLHDACRKGNLSRVRHILFQGLVGINSRDGNQGKTPLMVAAQEGQCNILDFLIRKGANKSYVDNDGKNFLHWACKGGHEGMVDCVIPNYGVHIIKKRVSPLMQAANLGYRDVFEFLVCMGANVSESDDDGDSALHWACRGRCLGIVKYLLSVGSVDINSRGKDGMTPLMVAVYSRQTAISQFLVSMGANLSTTDDDGNNALHIACEFGRLDVTEILLSQDSVDINSRGVHGWTPLMVAVYYGRRRVFDLLIRKGSLTHSVDDEGHNILHLACALRRVEMVKHILSQNLTDIHAQDKDGKTAAMIAKRNGMAFLFHGVVQ